MSTSKHIIKITTKGAKAGTVAIKKLSGSVKSMGSMALTAGKFTAGMGVAVAVAGGKAVKMAGEFDKVSQSFDNLNKKVGFGSGSLAKYQKALDGTVSASEIMKMSNNAMLLGIAESDDQMAKMFDTAQRLAAAVGQDAAYGVDSLVTGMGRQSKLMLDNLGIIVDTNKSYDDYAASIGKASKDLTDNEKKIAFNNAAMAEADRLVAKLGDEQLTTADKMSRMKAQFQDSIVLIGQGLAPAFDKALDVVAGFGEKFMNAMKIAMNIDYSATLTNIQNNFSALGELAMTSFTIFLDYIPDYFSNNVMPALGYAFEKIGQLGMILFEPVLAGGRLISAQVSNVFISMFNSLKEQYNNFASLVGMGTLDMTELFDTQALKDSFEGGTIMTAILGSADDNIKTGEDFANAIANAYSKAFNSFVVYKDETVEGNNEIVKSNNKVKKSIDAGSDATKESTKMTQENAIAIGQNSQSALGALRNIIKAKFATMMASIVSDQIGSKGFLGLATSAVLAAQASAVFERTVPKFAEGGDFVTSGPQMIMVGDNAGGQERVQVTPLSSPNVNGPQGGNVNVSFSGNVMSQDFIESQAIPQIKEAIRRGADIGIAN